MTVCSAGALLGGCPNFIGTVTPRRQTLRRHFAEADTFAEVDGTLRGLPPFPLQAAAPDLGVQ